MASPELDAFRGLEELGLILEGEYFSPSKANEHYYSELLSAVKPLSSKYQQPPPKIV